MILVRSETGKDFLERALAAGVLEVRDPDQEPKALEVMDRLARKQRERIDPFDPHAHSRWVESQALLTARQDALAGEG